MQTRQLGLGDAKVLGQPRAPLGLVDARADRADV